MTLKLANDEGNNKQDSRLRFSDEGQVGDSLQSSGTERQQIRENERDPWNMEGELQPVGISSIASTVKIDDYKESRRNGSSIVLKISKIIMYILIISAIASVGWISTQKLSDIYINALKFRWLYSLCGLAAVIDAVLVNILYQRKISLFFIAWFLFFLYPGKRNKHMNEERGVDTFLGIAYITAVLIIVGLYSKGILEYGAVLMAEEDSRAVAVEVLDQRTGDGTRIGDVISDNMLIEGVQVEKQAGRMVVGFSGMGKMGIVNGEFTIYNVKNVDTQIVFVKDMNSNEYEIAAAILDGTNLTQFGATYYWLLLQDN